MIKINVAFDNENRNGPIRDGMPYYLNSLFFNDQKDLNFEIEIDTSLNFVKLGKSFIFPINIRHYCHNLDLNDTAINNILSNIVSWIPDHILKACRLGKSIIILEDCWEAFIGYDDLLDKLYLSLMSMIPEKLKIPVSSCVFFNSNLKIKSTKTIGTVGEDFFKSHARNCEDLFEIKTIPNIKNTFLCLNRHQNQYRQFFVFDLFINDLLSNGIISLPKPNDEQFTQLLQKNYYLYHSWCSEIYHLWYISHAYNFSNILPLIADTTDFDTNHFGVRDLSIYDSTLLSIITETTCDNRFLFLTEKTYKTIAIGHPFMIMGCPGTLSYLKREGFKTFSDYWDESYDEEVYPRNRGQKIIQNLKFLSRLSLDDQQKLALELQEITSFNRHHLFNSPNKYGSKLYHYIIHNMKV